MMNLKKKIVVGVASAALIASMGVTPAFAAPITLPDGGQFDLAKQRLAGGNRLATSMAVAEKAYKDAKPRVAYVVGYDAVIDAATSGMLNVNRKTAPQWDGPVLSTPQDIASQKMLGSFLHQKWPSITKIVAIGGSAAVSEDALKTISEAAGAIKDRIGGKNRYETAVNIAEATKPGNDLHRLYVTRGDNPVDALSAGTLQNAPVLLLPPTGDVPESIQKFVKKHEVKFDDVVVVGGKVALSDEQISKMWTGKDKPKSPEVTPWTAEEVRAGYVDGVRKAAAVLWGQNAWQTAKAKKATWAGQLGASVSADTFDWNYDTPDTDIAEQMKTAEPGNFFPITKALPAGEDAPEESNDPGDVYTAGIPAKSKSFTGYLPLKAAVDSAEVWANGGPSGSANVIKLKAALDTAIQAAVNAGTTAEGLAAQATRDSDNNATGCEEAGKVCKAAQALFGQEFVKRNWVSVAADGSVNPGMFKFAGELKTDTLKGLSDDWAVLSAASASGNIVYVDKKTKVLDTTGTNNFNASYDSLAKRTSADDLTELFTHNQEAGNVLNADQHTSASINWWEIKNKINARTKSYYEGLKTAQGNLVEAVKAFNNVAKDNATSKVSEGGKDGALRIAGKDRYQTSAFLSVFQSKATTDAGKPNKRTGEGRFEDMKSVYLASGDQDHLIDPVFAGMVKDGTILLVPSTGEVDSLVAMELKRKGTTPRDAAKLKEGIRNTNVWAVGGKAAISDDVFKSAADAMFSK